MTREFTARAATAQEALRVPTSSRDAAPLVAWGNMNVHRVSGVDVSMVVRALRARTVRAELRADGRLVHQVERTLAAGDVERIAVGFERPGVTERLRVRLFDADSDDLLLSLGTDTNLTTVPGLFESVVQKAITGQAGADESIELTFSALGSGNLAVAGSLADSISVDLPSGWSEKVRNHVFDGGTTLNVFTKAGASETSLVIDGTGADTGKQVAFLYEFDDRDASDPWDSSTPTETVESSSPTGDLAAGALTPNTADCVMFTVGAQRGGGDDNNTLNEIDDTDGGGGNDYTDTQYAGTSGGGPDLLCDTGVRAVSGTPSSDAWHDWSHASGQLEAAWLAAIKPDAGAPPATKTHRLLLGVG